MSMHKTGTLFATTKTVCDARGDVYAWVAPSGTPAMSFFSGEADRFAVAGLVNKTGERVTMASEERPALAFLASRIENGRAGTVLSCELHPQCAVPRPQFSPRLAPTVPTRSSDTPDPDCPTL